MKENDFYEICDLIEQIAETGTCVNENNSNYYPKVEDIEDAFTRNLCTCEDIVPLLIYFSTDPYRNRKINLDDEYEKLVAYSKKKLTEIELEEE